MHIQIENITLQEPEYNKSEPNDILVIDNGTYKCKAGYKSNIPQIIFRNKIYKLKDQFSLESHISSSLKTMFENDVIINAEILEGTIDIIFNYLFENKITENKGTKKRRRIVENIIDDLPKTLIFTIMIDTPKHFKAQALSLLFDVYEFEKIQFGLDCYYSYLYNIQKTARAIGSEYDMIISMSYSNTMVVIVQNERIIKYYKLPFGGKLASEYLLMMINFKYFDVSFKLGQTEAEYLLQFISVCTDYKKEILEKYEEMKNGNIDNIIVSKTIKYVSTNDFKEPKTKTVKEKKKNVSQVEETEEKIPELSENIEINVKQEIENEEEVDEEKKKEAELKEVRRQKMIFYSSLYRFR